MRPLATLALAAALVLAVAGCAKRGMPSGGPPDVVAPRLESSRPDSGAAGVPRDAELSLTFSEGMEPQSTGEAVGLSPRIEVRQRRWKGRTLTMALAESLAVDRTYVLSVGGGARDRHGVAMGTGVAIAFSTADTFPPGRLAGRVDARGFLPAGAYVWCYRDGREPDSTAHDYDALGLADAEGRFAILGLPVPGRYRLWVFGDLNANRSFEPQTDVLAAADTLLELTRESPRVAGLTLRAVDPRAPATVAGAVLDTLGDSLGVLRVVAVSVRDTTVREGMEVGPQGGFELRLAPGSWTLRAYRDLDKDRRLGLALEPASEPLVIELLAADRVKELTLVLRRPGAVPSAP